MNTAQVSSKKALPTIINSEKQSPELMLSLVRYLTHSFSITGSTQYAHGDQKVSVKCVCRVHATWRAFIFMYFPPNGHLPEPKFKIHSMTIKAVIWNEKFPGKSGAQVLTDMLRLPLQIPVNVPSSPFPITWNFCSFLSFLILISMSFCFLRISLPLLAHSCFWARIFSAGGFWGCGKPFPKPVW